MSDLVRRLERHRSRFAGPEDRVRRRLRWAWLFAALWLVWVGFVSEHSLWRIWSLSRDNAAARHELRRVEADLARLEADAHDPRARRDQVEREARENGMARPGEIIYRIQSDVPSDSLAR